MIQFGNDKIKDIYCGSEPIEEVYYGSELVWRKKEYIQDGYWVHKDTNAVTYFGADADFITDGVMSQPSWMPNCSEVNIPEGVTSLGNNCFKNCSSLTSITLPESVISLGTFCFSGCTSLTSITIPESVVSLGAGCFYGCSSLTSINIPVGVTILEGSCFNGCSSLASINIPEGVTILDSYCFMNCSSLTLATVLPATPPTLGTYVFRNVHTSFIIKVRSPYVNAYKTATNWKSYASKITAI